MVGKTTREYPKTEEEQLSEAAKAAFGWQGTCSDAFTYGVRGICRCFFSALYQGDDKIVEFIKKEIPDVYRAFMKIIGV